MPATGSFAMNESTRALLSNDDAVSLARPSFPLLPSEFSVAAKAETELVRMFRDPYQLEKDERALLIANLRALV
jgi:hypothetical protein